MYLSIYIIFNFISHLSDCRILQNTLQPWSTSFTQAEWDVEIHHGPLSFSETWISCGIFYSSPIPLIPRLSQTYYFLVLTQCDNLSQKNPHQHSFANDCTSLLVYTCTEPHTTTKTRTIIKVRPNSRESKMLNTPIFLYFPDFQVA